MIYRGYNYFFLVLWDREIYCDSRVLQKHIHTCATHTITECSGCASERLSCFGTERSSDTVTSRLIVHFCHEGRESKANMALLLTHWQARQCRDQTTAGAPFATTLNVWLSQESTWVNQVKLELGRGTGV